MALTPKTLRVILFGATGMIGSSVLRHQLAGGLRAAAIPAR